jgi:hypothetical protein
MRGGEKKADIHPCSNVYKFVIVVVIAFGNIFHKIL